MKQGSLLLAILLLSGLCGVAWAHDGVYADEMNPAEMTLSTTINWDHNEALDNDPRVNKGTATVFVTNNGTQAWGDFHFSIYSVTGYGDATSVLFTEEVNPSMTGYTAPHSLDDWDIGTEGGFSVIDLYYYTNPVNPGETVSFTVYTDNTAGQLDFFGISFHPTPVPEPASLLLLAFGGLAIRRMKK